MEEELERSKRYFMEQFVLNQAYIVPNLNTFNAVAQANQAWKEIEKVMKDNT